MCAQPRLSLSPRRLTQLWRRAAPAAAGWLLPKPARPAAPDFVLPPTRARTLVTIHDLSFLIYPQFAARRHGALSIQRRAALAPAAPTRC
ncbi:MAG: hypothetical protein U0Z44_20870 [Kouleothrix sp.]